MGTDNELPHSAITWKSGEWKALDSLRSIWMVRVMDRVASADNPRPVVAYGSAFAGAGTHEVCRFRKRVSGDGRGTRAARSDTRLALPSDSRAPGAQTLFLDVTKDGRP